MKPLDILAEVFSEIEHDIPEAEGKAMADAIQQMQSQVGVDDNFIHNMKIINRLMVQVQRHPNVRLREGVLRTLETHPVAWERPLGHAVIDTDFEGEVATEAVPAMGQGVAVNISPELSPDQLQNIRRAFQPEGRW